MKPQSDMTARICDKDAKAAAAHCDRAEKWDGTISFEKTIDAAGTEKPSPPLRRFPDGRDDETSLLPEPCASMVAM